jgi:TetR/AcrR family transcriptional repressor of mexJK operon
MTDPVPSTPPSEDEQRGAGPATGREQGTRAVRKRRAILAAATLAFLRNGYLGTSMDEIAALAAVSKQTVYKHFGDKEGLFTEIVTSTVNEASDPVHEGVRHLADSDDIEADLEDLARRQLATVIQPQLMQLRRLVIAEVGRFPELGRLFFERGPGRTMAALASAFERLAERGVLELNDPALAAAHFNWLVMSAPVNEAMLLGRDEAPAPDELDRYAEGGVRVFLAAYGAKPSAAA